MERYKKLFSKLINSNEGAFVPFVILGDPNPIISLQIIDTIINAGADALELGIPFSDPLADGPTIQKANLRAFNSGVTFDSCFEMLTTIRKKYISIPIGLLIYANLVYNKGLDFFYYLCNKVGIDSVLVADVPLLESLSFRNSARRYNISPIFICPPNADLLLLQEITLYSKAYIYLLSRPGVTGIENKGNILLTNLVNKLKKYNAAPILQGFGISEPEQVRIALHNGISGVISGSAIISIIEYNLNNTSLIFKKIFKFIFEMKAATYLKKLSL
ncbi:Tryptophan synthase alpha chain [secondary endosymbiont of Trabutina mannipara]|uniref:Tryptophan synthase alpha chain n=1 Tax=secondary endosymbiont of Trabutina mannipara TaxID=1835721 RepID=A0A1C3L3N4_9ENTR|nr:tryptophan synthase subunit alpha [secondary endosymbiont of Trabutina mannipara]SBT81900.1 Tryptophan synthase alpha chain [secondary endosymbiont of Trabutina mannipara]